MGTPTDDYAVARDARDAATHAIGTLARGAAQDPAGKAAINAWNAIADYFDGIAKQLDARAAEAQAVKVAQAEPVKDPAAAAEAEPAIAESDTKKP